MKFDFLQIILIIFSVFLIYSRRSINLYLNSLLFTVYFLYKIILSSKGGIYLDIFSIIVLLIIVSINLQKSKYNIFIYSLVILYFVTNFNNILDNKFNLNIDNNEVCELKNLNKKEYIELNKDNYFLLYYAPKFSEYNFIQKLC
tara:strand:- start:517 stop:948 length:432 start_codon:yes stop_codon:yes gene_type:complete